MHKRNMMETGDLIGTNHPIRTFILGAAIGAGVALLLAPASGSDTRHKLGNAARRIRKETGDRLHDLRVDAEEAVEKGREAYRQTRDAVKSGVKESSGPRPGV